LAFCPNTDWEQQITLRRIRCFSFTNQLRINTNQSAKKDGLSKFHISFKTSYWQKFFIKRKSLLSSTILLIYISYNSNDILSNKGTMLTIPLAISSIRVYNEENLLFIEQKIFFFFSIFSVLCNIPHKGIKSLI